MNPGFRLFAGDNDRIEKASFETDLTADAIVDIHAGLEAAAIDKLMGVGQFPVEAAIAAAITYDVIDLLPVIDDVNQPFFFGLVQKPHRFHFRDRPSVPL